MRGRRKRKDAVGRESRRAPILPPPSSSPLFCTFLGGVRSRPLPFFTTQVPFLTDRRLIQSDASSRPVHSSAGEKREREQGLCVLSTSSPAPQKPNPRSRRPCASTSRGRRATAAGMAQKIDKLLDGACEPRHSEDPRLPATVWPLTLARPPPHQATPQLQTRSPGSTTTTTPASLRPQPPAPQRLRSETQKQQRRRRRCSCRAPPATTTHHHHHQRPP